MTVQCIDCQHFNLRSAGQMAKLGYGHCELEVSKASFQSATFARHCPDFDPAAADAADKRRAWLDREKKQFMKEVSGK